MNKIFNYLDEIIPNPKCELIYNKDYELLIAVMLSAQTTDKSVNKVTKILFEKYKTLDSLSNACLFDIISIIKPIGTYNKKAKNLILISQELKKIGYVPNDYNYLISLPGIGRKTANLVLSMIYNEPYIAVDTHVIRVTNRLGLVNSKDVRFIENELYKLVPSNKLSSFHHQLVLFGRYFCKAKNPLCETCKLKEICKKNEE